MNVPESKITKELPPTTLEYTMTGLRPDAVYTVRVYASTIAGPGPQRAATLQLTADTPGNCTTKILFIPQFLILDVLELLL